MTRLLPLLTVLLLTLAASACGDAAAPSDATPRRRGYPRLPEYDSIYAAAPRAPLHLELNAAACVADSNAGRWLTVSYPRHSSYIYITVSTAASADELKDILANRRERIGLNLGGMAGETTHIASADGGFEAALVEAPGAGTPLQFVATDGAGYVVSGAARIDVAADAPFDSISPIVATLRRDIVHMLSHLHAP